MNTFVKAIVFALIFCSFDVNAKLFEIEEFYLNNGLHVVVIPNHKAPIVKQMIWYKAGSIDEDSGKGGIAHLLEHLMFRGTKKVKGSTFNDIIAANGGYSNAFTSHDFTVYHEFLDISRLEAAMALEADRMVNLDISDDAFLGERQIVYQERQERIADNPPAIFGETLNRVLWQDNPYSRPVSGTEEEIKNLRREDAVTFYNRHYGPDNAVLVLAGDIDGAVARQLAEKYFGSIAPRKKSFLKNIKAVPQKLKNLVRADTTGTGEKKEAAANNRDFEKNQEADQPVTVKAERADKSQTEPSAMFETVPSKKLFSAPQSLARHQYRVDSAVSKVQATRLIQQYVVPSLKDDVKTAYALMVFSKYLGEGDNSFLNQQLVLSGKAAAAGSSYDGLSRGPATFMVMAVLLPETNIAKMEILLEQKIKQALNSLTEEMLEQEKRKMLAGLVYIQDNPEDAAMLAGNMAALGLKASEINQYEEYLRQVRLDDVKNAVTQMLNNASSITGILRPYDEKKGAE